MLNKGLHSEKVGSWKPEAGRLLSDRQNRHSSRHPVPIAIGIVSGSEKLNSAASDPLCVSPQGGKAHSSQLVAQGSCNPQNQNAYGKCLINQSIGRGKNQFNVTGRVPESTLYDPLCISPQGGKLLPLGEIERGQGIEPVYSADTKQNETTQFTPPRGEKEGAPTLIVLNGKHPKPNEKSNINTNRIDETLKPKCQSTNKVKTDQLEMSNAFPLGGNVRRTRGSNSKNTFCNLKTGWNEETSTISQHPTRSGARFQTSPLWGEWLTASSTDGDRQAKGVKGIYFSFNPSPRRNRTQVLT